MNIREMRPEDVPELERIHKELYQDQFPFPDFSKHYLCAFVVVDDAGKIISGGGIKCILEDIVVTDTNYSPRERYSALASILQASLFVAEKHGFNQLHAYTQEAGWKGHLEKVGFVPIKGNGLVLNF